MEYPYLAERDLGDHTWGYVIHMGVNWRILVGPHMSEAYYDDAWCYATPEGAIAALAAWEPASETEPSGWIKHPASGRYRPFGDASREFHANDPPPHPALR